MIQVWCYGKSGFFTESIFVDEVKEDMTEIPITFGFYKAKWDGKGWVEGATKEEIEAWDKENTPVEQQTTEQQLLETQALLANLQEQILLKENGGI